MAALPLPAGLDGYVFKARSPSCGLHGIARYGADGQPGHQRGPGLYAGRVLAAGPLLPTEDEGRLTDRGLRRAFVERLFARARLRELLAGPWRPRDLVAFHTRHKLQLLAHDPARYREAGRVVAQAGRRPREEVAGEYAGVFCAAMAGQPTPGRHTNALLHAFSLVSEHLDDTRRADLVARIEDYRRGGTPLGVPVALLSHHPHGDDLAWLAEQTYLAPYPAELATAE